MSAIPIAAFDDLADGEPRRVDVEGVRICVVRLGDAVHALGDTCTHADVSLAEGEVDPDECTVECPQHGSAFDLRTGDALSLPAVKGVPVYPANVVDGQVEVELP